jgi:hypothetical protein
MHPKSYKQKHDENIRFVRFSIFSSFLKVILTLFQTLKPNSLSANAVKSLLPRKIPVKKNPRTNKAALDRDRVEKPSF